MTNLSPTIQKIVKQAEKEFPWISDTLIIWIIDKLQDVESKAWQDGYIQGRKDDRIAHQKLSHLKSEVEKKWDLGYDCFYCKYNHPHAHEVEENTE